MEKMGKCIIVAASNFCASQFHPAAEDFVIAADAGYSHLLEIGVKPDLLLGDLDSLEYSPSFENLLKFPVEKDDTDTMLAIKEGLRQGYKKFQIFGGLGGRFDHSIANVQSLCYLTEHGAYGMLVGETESVLVIRGTGHESHKIGVSFSEKASGVVSVFSLSDCCKGIDIYNLHYGLENGEISNKFPLGVSNKFEGKKSRIALSEGTMMIIFPTDCMDSLDLSEVNM